MLISEDRQHHHKRSRPESKPIAKDSSTTMSVISLSSPYLDAFAFDLFSKDPRGPPMFIEHYTMKIDDSPTYTAFLTVEFPRSDERLQLKRVEEISATSRRTDWPDKSGVSDWDIRNKALEKVYKELRRRKRELILNGLREEIARLDEEDRRVTKLLNTKYTQRQRLMDPSWDASDGVELF